MLDASHELRTPLTSLRTNMEVARRLEELAPEEREVLISDVLTQLDELTTLVGDLAELARGEQPQPTTEPIRLDSIVLEAVEVATTHGRSRERDLRRQRGPDLGVRVVATDRTGGGQPARQRPQVEPGRRRGRGGLLRRDGDRPGPRSRVSTTATSTIIFDRFYRAPGARADPARAWAWPSWPRWPATRGAASTSTTPGRWGAVPVQPSRGVAARRGRGRRLTIRLSADRRRHRRRMAQNDLVG